ncbi:nitrate reductase [Ancylobacter dichloromethanicus]|uniref:Nitrate reductase n=1 Tax=Ancylobacter dichloromethanicus TaxID=518825 RepID=A0A9W6J9N3_9HYPH|nr:nitrate reductase [Ancylobacter dichloromethanicus]MBS7555868.1 nitrate reductase [Ancylobacter dichloromethanicus]GLK72411.1 nitrate reductase [Ancylobacter dichloromethanicus]
MNAPVPGPIGLTGPIVHPAGLIGHPPVRTTCPYCGVGCGVLATPDGQGGAAIAGDPEHPANFGRLCSKGAALGETLGLETRLLHPLARNDNGVLERVGWDTALDRIARTLAATIDRHGPESVAFYLSGQLLTEDYYAANKLAKGFLGTANVDTNSRLCMASSVAGHKRAFGSDTVPGVYEDLDEADLVVLVGSNAAWCHPVLFRRIEAARARRGTRLVVIDPRRTATGDEADLFLPVNAGKDTIIFSGLLVWLAENGALDEAYIARHTSGFDVALATARQLAPSLASAAAQAGVSVEALTAFYRLFAQTPRVVTCYSQGVNQSAQGTDKVGAIINCHLATGRIGRVGSGPFSLTGQPNAMGGREVGGLANQLAAHMDFSPANIDRVRRFWQAPRLAEREGLKAVEMFDAIAGGRIKALWVMGTNPAVSLPKADRVREALRQLDFLVISDNVAANDTIGCNPHLLLPALAWGEKDGTVTNSERCISRQRAFLPPPGEAKADWWAITEVARRLGHEAAFGWEGAADIFREHAALSAFENAGTRDFDLTGLTDLDPPSYDTLPPTQWPRPDRGAEAATRFFAEGRFYTPDGRARFIAPEPPQVHEACSKSHNLLLNTGRIRDQWHTMTRSGLSPRLGAHLPVPFAELNADDAAGLGILDGSLVRVESVHGSVVVEARLCPGQRPGTVFVPIHWSEATSSAGRVGGVIAGTADPYSGQPELKATPVAIERVDLPYRGFILSRDSMETPRSGWWARARIGEVIADLIADERPPHEWLREGMGEAGPNAVHLVDRSAGRYRLADFDAAGRVRLIAFIERSGRRLDWTGPLAWFDTPPCDASRRGCILSGRADNAAAGGVIVCACHSVAQPQIEALMESHPGLTVAGLGTRLKAGTNCGSCIPELRRLLAGQPVAT